MKSGNLNFLEPSGPLQACNGTDLSEDGVYHTETCRRDLINCAFNILYVLGWNIEEVFEGKDSIFDIDNILLIHRNLTTTKYFP